jgi:6-phosphogluconolactonase (cycloisomerase 2 family)
MRMKFNKSSQLLLASAVSLLAAGLMASCGSATTDFVFVASSKAISASNLNGQIDVFEINSVSGAMRQIPTSPFPSLGLKPVAEAVSPDNTTLYVVNHDDDTIVQFLIGNDGKLYPQNTVNTPGAYPLAVAANGSHLFVLDSYQPLSNCSTSTPCSGSIAVYPILTAAQASLLTPSEPADTLGTPLTYPLTLPSSTGDLLEPTAINVLASGAYLYVTAYDATSGANYIFGFSVGSGGALTALNGGYPLLNSVPFATGTCPSAYLNAPYLAGTCPAAIASDSSSSYVYVTDALNGTIHGYLVASGTGLLSELSTPISAGGQPLAIAVDTKYPYAYVTNAAGNVQAYSITSGSGVLTSIGTYVAGIQPVAIGIDPSTNHFLFTANFNPDETYGTVSDFELSTTAGTLINTQGSPYTASALPTAVAAVPHGGSQ